MPLSLPAFLPTLPFRPTMLRSNRSSILKMCTNPPASPFLYSRRTFVATVGTMLSLSTLTHLERALADSAPPLSMLQSARQKLDEVDALISSARWNAVRTVLAREPVSRTKEACNTLIGESDSSMRGAIVGLREDALSDIRLLDTAVYSNVFVGEDRQILGTKVDYDVPRIYLKELKDALDELIGIASS